MEDNFIYLENQNATHRLIFLHGWGADAEDLVPFGRALVNAFKADAKFDLVFLRAPQLHPDAIGRQWYPLFPVDWSSVPDAVEDLQMRIINLPIMKIPITQTFLLGFSQGAAMALASGCQFDLAGIIACSPYGHPNWDPKYIKPPLLLTHVTNDDVVPLEAAKMVFKLINKKQPNSELFIFTGGHEMPGVVMGKIFSFLEIYI